MAKVTATGLGFAAVAAKIGATQMPDQIALAAGPAAAAVMTTGAAASVSLIAIFVGWLGPNAGPVALVSVFAFGGSLWAVSGATTATRMAAWMLALKCMLISLALTFSVAGALDKYAGIPLDLLIAPVALIFAAMGDGWKLVFDAVSKAISRKIESLGGPK